MLTIFYVLIIFILFIFILYYLLRNRGLRPYKPEQDSVGVEYDDWTDEGILEHYSGEHIHVGYYDDKDIQRGFFKKNFIEAMLDFTKKLEEFSKIENPKRILDVGCGIGGTTRYFHKKYPDAEIVGITISQAQIKRAKELDAQAGIKTIKYCLENAKKMSFDSNYFDLVWVCQSTEHMEDKKACLKEMVRVLQKEGTIIVTAWCKKNGSLTPKEQKEYQYLCDIWSHPNLASINEYVEIFKELGLMNIQMADWNKNIQPFWLHFILQGLKSPWKVISSGPKIWYKITIEIIAHLRYYKAFRSGLITQGVISGTKG